MKRFMFLFVLAILISGCAKEKPASHQVGDAAKESIQTIVAAKPECQDVGRVCESQIDSIIASCDLESQKITQEKLKYQWGFYGILVVIGLFFAKKVLK